MFIFLSRGFALNQTDGTGSNQQIDPANFFAQLFLLSAGIGRTGCFIATSILCKQLRTEGVVDILRTTCQLRLDR